MRPLFGGGGGARPGALEAVVDPYGGPYGGAASSGALRVTPLGGKGPCGTAAGAGGGSLRRRAAVAQQQQLLLEQQQQGDDEEDDEWRQQQQEASASDADMPPELSEAVAQVLAHLDARDWRARCDALRALAALAPAAHAVGDAALAALLGALAARAGDANARVQQQALEVRLCLLLWRSVADNALRFCAMMFALAPLHRLPLPRRLWSSAQRLQLRGVIFAVPREWMSFLDSVPD